MLNLKTHVGFLVGLLMSLASARASAQNNWLQGSTDKVQLSGGNPALPYHNWEIDQGQTIVATNSNPNGWSVTFFGILDQLQTVSPTKSNKVPHIGGWSIWGKPRFKS